MIWFHYSSYYMSTLSRRIMDAKQRTIAVDEKMKVVKLKVKVGTMIYDGRVLLIYVPLNDDNCSSAGKQQKKFKSPEVGVVRRILIKEGDVLTPGSPIIELEKECNHPTVIKDLCAECGADLQKENVKDGGQVSQASVSMVHMVPELKVNDELAQMLGKADMDRLLKHEKLVLLVDLDQTLIHTTNDNIPNNIRDVYHFQLSDSRSPWYHTRLRPGTHNFLEGVSEKFELHICTFGSRRYAHTIAKFLDPEGKFFSHRILSRDECFNPNSKTANLKALFPCGQNMVCIIDDREDVWDYASNLIHVKPYHFFQHTGDIHAPPGLTKCENDESARGFDFSQFENVIEEENSNDVADGSLIIDAFSEVQKNVDGESEEDSDPDEKTKGNTLASCAQTKKEEVAKVNGELVCDEVPTGAEIVLPDSTADIEDSELIADTCKSQRTNAANLELTTGTEESELISDPKESSKEKVGEICADDFSSTTTTDDKAEPKSVEKQQEVTLHTNAPTLPEQTLAVADTDLVPTPQTVDSVNPPANSETVHRTESKLDADGFITIEEADDYLLYLEEILKIIHVEFFRRFEKTGEMPDLKQVVPETRATVLSGVSMVFSGIVPNRIRLEDSPAYKIACSLGATVTQNIEGNTTHLVALRAGTAKVYAAYKRKSLKLVTPEWLWTCAERWEKVDERLFPLKDVKPNTESRNPPAHCRSPDHPEPLPFTYQTNVPSSHPPPVSGFLYSINPLMTLSSEDIETMEGEVEDIFKESDGEADIDANEIFKPDEEETEESGVRCTVRRKRKLDDEDSSSTSESIDASEKRSRNISKLKRRKRRKHENFTEALDDYFVNYAENEKDEDDEDEEDESDDETINSKFRRGMDLPSDLDIDYNTGDGTEEEVESDGDWNDMGKALEREFLGE